MQWSSFSPDLFAHATVTHEFIPMEPATGFWEASSVSMCRIHVTLVFECSLDDDPTFVIQSADQRSSHSCLEAIPYVAVIKTRAACPPIWSERMRNRLERNKILGQFFHHVLNQTSIRINELDAEQLMHPNDSTLSGFQFQLDSVIYGKPRVALLH